ncbi:hypothetical protein PsYK624_171600 [Phanerochaete sordida]|uniref:Uncharacterized protein n=1 Tax=Phanerochaete sordida TaxID=48140 RepID=A0A9P3LPT4_9APHY|nr:hypothetical protein PsYK624_171600 [Phanerochaete sordida]
MFSLAFTRVDLRHCWLGAVRMSAQALYAARQQLDAVTQCFQGPRKPSLDHAGKSLAVVHVWTRPHWRPRRQIPPSASRSMLGTQRRRRDTTRPPTRPLPCRALHDEPKAAPVVARPLAPGTLYRRRRSTASCRLSFVGLSTLYGRLNMQVDVREA